MGWFDDCYNHVGALYTRFSNDISAVYQFSGPGVAGILQACFNLSAGLLL